MATDLMVKLQTWMQTAPMHTEGPGPMMQRWDPVFSEPEPLRLLAFSKKFGHTCGLVGQTPIVARNMKDMKPSTCNFFLKLFLPPFNNIPSQYPQPEGVNKTLIHHGQVKIKVQGWLMS